MDELTKAAVAGIARAALPPPSHATERLVAELDLSPERAFLLRAAGVSLERRTGARAATRGKALEPAPPEARPVVPRALAGCLSRALDDEPAGVLVEVAEALADRGYVAPPALLLRILDCARTEDRQALGPLLGARGRWLAQRSQRWAWARGHAPFAEVREADLPPLRAAFDEGTTQERVRALLAARRIDPGAARGWLEESFRVDKADVRLRLLGALEVGLSGEDVAFLSTCLEDRSVGVRRAAATLVARLGEGPDSEAILERAASFLAFEGGGILGRVRASFGGSAGRLRVTLPPEWDPTWARFGLTEKSPHALGRLGPKAGWLAQWLSLPAPSRLAARLGSDVRSLLAAAAAHDHADGLIAGLGRAAAAHADTEAAEHVLRRVAADGATRDVVTADREVLGRLLALATPDAIAEVLEAALAPAHKTGAELACIVDALPRPWPTTAVGAFVRAFERHGHVLDAYLPSLASGAPPETFELLDALVSRPDQDAHARRALDRLAETIDFRRRFHRELQNDRNAQEP